MIEVKNLNKSFSSLQVLKNISCKFPSTGISVILGKSGCGKTTLLNSLGGLDTFKGEIIYEDGFVNNGNFSIKLDLYRSKHIGYIFQNFYLLKDLSVEENIREGLIISGIYDKKEQNRCIMNSLKAVNMYLYRRRLASQLSLGQKQRVAIARAIASNPDVLLVDEPTGNLDSENSLNILNILKEISLNIPIILVTHNKVLAYQYGDHFFLLVDGVLKNINKEDLSLSDDEKYELETTYKKKIVKPIKAKLTSYLETFKVVVIDNIKKIVIKNNESYSFVKEEDLLKYSNNDENQTNDNQEQFTSFEKVEVNKSSKLKMSFNIFKTKKSKRNIITALISIFLGFYLCYSLNSAYLADNVINNTTELYDSNSVGGIYDGKYTYNNIYISKKEKEEILSSSSVTGFLSDQVILLDYVKFEDVSLKNIDSLPINSRDRSVYLINSNQVGPSFSKRGYNIKSLKENEALIDIKLIETLTSYSPFTDDFSKYIDSYISINNSRYKIVGTVNTNLQSIIVNESEDTFFQNLIWGKSFYKNMDLNFKFKPYKREKTDYLEGNNFYVSEDLLYNFNNPVAKGFPSEVGLNNDLVDYANNYVSNYQLFAMDVNLYPDFKGDRNTIYYDEEILTNENLQNKTFTDFLTSFYSVNTYYDFKSSLNNPLEKFINYYNYEYITKYPDLALNNIGTKENFINIYIRKDFYDTFINSKTLSFAKEINNLVNIAGTYDDNSKPIILLDKSNYRFINNMDVSSNNYGTEAKLFLTTNMSSSIKNLSEFFDGTNSYKYSILNYYDFTMVNSGNTFYYVTYIIIGVISLILVILYAILNRSNIVVDLEKIGIYRSLGLIKLDIYLNYITIIMKKLLLFFLPLYIINTIIVAFTYKVYLPIYMLILIPIITILLTIFISIIPLFVQLRKPPRLLINANQG